MFAYSIRFSLFSLYLKGSQHLAFVGAVEIKTLQLRYIIYETTSTSKTLQTFLAKSPNNINNDNNSNNL